MSTVIKVDNLSKVYRVGEWGTGTISHDLNRWWQTKIRRREDPYSKVGSVNDRTQKALKGEYVSALKDISFEVKQGEVLGIIGKNGAGKSTLLKVLSRITAPTTGNAHIKGRVASLLEVGTGFHPEMTGRENIYLNGTINGMNRHEISHKLDEIVDFAGIAKYLDTPVKRFSSGMTVRLGFAVAAFLEPEILIVDEVLAVGDAEFQKKAIGKMQDVSKGEGRTVLFVSHNMVSISSLCNRSIFLENGFKAFDGPTKETIDQYISLNKNSNNDFKFNASNRQGSGKIRIKDILLFDLIKNIQLKSVISGSDLLFQTSYEILRQNQIINENLYLGIQIYFENGQFLTAMNSNNFSKSYSAKKNEKIKCIIRNLPLMPGKYRINLVLKDKTEIHDLIENAIELNVEPGDFYHTGIENSYNRQGVFLNYSFH